MSNFNTEHSIEMGHNIIAIKCDTISIAAYLEIASMESFLTD